ncbi:MAG: M43 family zinc metalloprotease, partial [Bacteroidia bacterium]|nr:M43 family zinc metalloprotease [Bacteroidia bacterium]
MKQILTLALFAALHDLYAQSSSRTRYENFVREYLARSAQSTETQPRFIIPTVVHVVFSDSSHRASPEQVRSEFEHLRKLFRRLPGTYGFGAGVDTRIEFELATVAPDGSRTDGITYTQNSVYAELQVGPEPNADYPGSENTALKTLVGWDRNKYLNIWVVERIVTLDDQTELAGYAQYPWEEATTTDGVVICSKYFGSKNVAGSTSLFAYDYTTAKNLGHWLGLLNVYEPGGCTPDDCTQTGDRVCDTPPSYSRPKRSDERTNSCNLEAGEDRPDLVRNIMENCIQPAAPNQFTAGQAARCRA